MSYTRRQFVQTAAAALAGPTLLTGRARGQRSANDRINLGFIGVGTMGRGHLGAFLGKGEVQVVAVCDVVRERRESAHKMVEERYAQRNGKAGHRFSTMYNDYRALLARPDLDAVVIATPDHWHALPCLLAARSGKHIYCEKPLTLTIAEGRAIVDAVKKHKVVFQTGSQQRSEFGGRFIYAAELVKAGAIGKVHTVRIGVGAPAQPCDLPEQPIPDGTDWDLWMGPTPVRGYNEILCPKGIHRHFPAWRNYREYAGGGLADMGAHHFDIAQWALGLDNTGPVKVEPPASGNTGLKFTYANGVVMHHGGPTDCLFEGEKGTIAVSRGHLEVKPDKLADPEGIKKHQRGDHRRNWLESIRAQKDPVCTAEIGHRSATICHLGNIGYQLRKTLTWDPAEEKFVGDAEANRLVSRTNRAPWTA